jgi:hypothetical protein
MTGDIFYSPDNLCHILPGGMKNILQQRGNALSQKQHSAAFSQDKKAEDTKSEKSCEREHRGV